MGGEIRPTYILKAFDRKVLPMRILSFGTCNFRGPYCKREGQPAVEADGEEVFDIIAKAVKAGEVVRLSGGDPVMYPDASLKFLRKCRELGGICSVVHNGSSVRFIESLLPYLDFAAIDLKAGSPEELELIAGLKKGLGSNMLKNSLKIQEILSTAGVLVDVRTCVFSTTTLDQLLHMAEMTANSGKIENKFWTIRSYNPVEGCGWEPLPKETTLQYIKAIKKEFPELKLGMRASWEPSGFLYF